MKLIENIDKKTYEEFMDTTPRNHFLQSYNWGQFYHNSMGYQANYVGLVDDNDSLVAVALLLEKRLPFGFTHLSAPRGFIIDFTNHELLKLFTEEVVKYAKKKKALFIKINPDIDIQEYDLNGNIKKEGKNNYQLVQLLQKLGYRHLGYNKNFEASQPRYTFRLNIEDDLDNIFRNFHSTTKRWIKKDITNTLDFYKNEEADIADFYLTMLETAKREKITQHNLAYYQTLYQLLSQDDMTSLYVVKVKIAKLKAYYKDKLSTLENEQKKLALNPEKNAKALQEIENQMRKLTAEEQNTQAFSDAQEIVLSSILTVDYRRRSWLVYIGNNSILRDLGANYYICYRIIKDMKERGFRLIDFFGTTGDLNEDNPVYGIHRFKKSFGGIYHEFLGDFDYPVNKPLYFIFITLVPFYRKIVRLLNRVKS